METISQLRNNVVVKTVSAAPEQGMDAAERRTRDRIKRSLLDHGPSTVAELSARAEEILPFHFGAVRSIQPFG